MEGKFVSYLRVSTQRQGHSGLGREAQRHAVEQYLNGGKWKLVAEYVEIESGKRPDRPQLAAAIARCKTTGAKLVIAKLDRLGRNVHFVSGLMQSLGKNWVAADSPNDDAFTLHIKAAVAEKEALDISIRTKAALAAAKRRGVVLGRPAGQAIANQPQATAAASQKARRQSEALRSILSELDAQGVLSARQTALALNERNIPAPRGGPWYLAQALRLRKMLDRKPRVKLSA